MNPLHNTFVSFNSQDTPHITKRMGSKKQSATRCHNNTNVDRHQPMREHGVYGTEQGEAKMRGVNTVFFELAKAAHAKRAHMFGEQSEYLDCKTMSCYEDFKSTISDVSNESDALEIVSTTSSSWHDTASEIDGNVEDEVTKYVDISAALYRGTKNLDKVTRFSDCVSEVSMKAKKCLDTDTAFQKLSSEIDSHAQPHNLTKSRSRSSLTKHFLTEEISESETYYNDPQIDTLDIFKPERFGRNYFKTNIRSSKQRVSYECPEMSGFRNELDLAERIFLSTNSGGLSPKVFESRYYEGSPVENSNEGEVSIFVDDVEGITYYHSPENKNTEKSFGFKNNSLPDKESIKIKAKPEVDMPNSKLSFDRLVRALDALDKKEKVSLLTYANSEQKDKLCHKDEIKKLDTSIKRRFISIIDKISSTYANYNVTPKKPNRRKRKVRKHRSGVSTNRESNQKQDQQGRKTILTTGSVSFIEIKPSQDHELNMKHNNIAVVKIKDDNSNRIKTRFSRATSRDSCSKVISRKTSPSPTQNISSKSPNRYGKTIAASHIQMGNQINPTIPQVSSQVCRGLNPLSTSSDVFKTVRENRQGQTISNLNQSHSATKKNVSHIPPRPVPSDRAKKPEAAKKPNVDKVSAATTEQIRNVSQASFSKSIIQDKEPNKVSDPLKNSSKDTFESVMETFREKMKTHTIKPLAVDAKVKVGTSKQSDCQIKTKEKIDFKSKAIADVMKSIQARASGLSKPSGDNKCSNREPIKSALDLFKERNAPKQIQTSSKTDTRSEKTDFRIASLLGKGRKFNELKRKGALLGTSDISLVKGDRNMNKDTATSNTAIGSGDALDKFKYGRRLHEDLDKPTVPTRAAPNPFRKVVTIPRLNFSSQKEGSVAGGIPRLSLDSSKLRDQRKILQEESKSLFKEVQDQFYRSNKLQQESGDIVKSVMYGDFNSPQKSPMKFIRGDFDADFEPFANKGPPEISPDFLRDRVERPDTVRKLNNRKSGACSSQPKIDCDDLEKPKLPSPMILNDDFFKASRKTGISNLSNYPDPFISKDSKDDITSLSRLQFEGDRQRILKSHLPEHQAVAPWVPRSTQRVNITNDTLNQALSTLNKERKYSPANRYKPSNRKLISYNHSNSKLGMSLPEVVSYKPSVIKHADVEPKPEYKSSEKSRLKPTNNSGTSFILLRGNSMSKTENAKPEKMHKLGVTKPRTWSSLQSKQNINVEKKDSGVLTSSEHVPKASVVPIKHDKPNRAVVSLGTTGRKQEAKKPVVRTININSHHDSCTQTCKPTNDKNADQSNISKRDRRVSIQESKNSVSHRQTRHKITKSPRRRSISNTSVKRRKGNTAHVQSQHKHATSRGNRYLSDSLEHTVSSSNIQSNKFGESLYEAYPPKAYLESATTFASSVTASRTRGGASIPSSSIGSLNSSQFYEFIYPPKKSAQRGHVTPNMTGNGTLSESNYWEPESYGKMPRNKSRTPPKWKLRNERKTDPINTNERIWGWIRRSEETPSSMTDEYELPRRRGHFDESGHAQEYNSNDPYTQRRESPGRISIHPQRRSSSLPSKLLARARALDPSMYQGDNDYESVYPSHTAQGRYTGGTQDWSPMRSHASLSAKAYLQKYQSGTTGNHRLGVSDPGGNIYADVNHGHNPLESRTDETDRRFSDFESKVQNQISRRSQDSVARESNRHIQNSYERDAEERRRSTMNAFSYKSNPKSNTHTGFESETDIRRITGGKSFDVYKGSRSAAGTYEAQSSLKNTYETSQQRPTQSTNTGYEPRYKSAMSTRDNSPTYQRSCSRRGDCSPYSLETGRPQNCSPCDAGKICSGEQKMYAWPPMFVSPHGQGQGNQYSGGYGGQGQMQLGPHDSKNPRLLAMMSSQPYRLTQKDLQCSEDDVECTQNYVIKKYSGVPGSCSDVVKCVRESYLKNMKLVVDGPGNVSVRDPNYDAQGEFKLTDNRNQPGFKVSLIPSPPRRY